MWWFAIGQVLLYIASAQFLSGGLGEIVGGMARGVKDYSSSWASGVLTTLLVGGSWILWLVLLFAAPLHFLRKGPRGLVPTDEGERRSLHIAYWALVFVVFFVLACGAFLKAHPTGGTLPEFAWKFVEQVFRPITWAFSRK